jgi:F-type H+-transporting ATPase subunit gamma
MANLKNIRIRIASVSSTKQITSAMKMVSAAKLRRAQNSIIQLRPYANKLNEILGHISSYLDSHDENVYSRERDKKKVLLVVITSNRGLCGAFNTNVVKKSLELLNTDYLRQGQFGNVDFMVIGKKGSDQLKHKKVNIISTNSDIYNHLTYDRVIAMADTIMESFRKGKYDRVDLIYNQFKNPAVQILIAEQFLPIKKEFIENTTLKQDYILEPSKEYIIEQLIPKSLKIQFYKALLDSVASEHGARMTAMHKATENATEIIRQLKLNYNKARQTAITKEILEIVGGANALKG